MLYHRLRTPGEMVEIGQANAVDPGRMASGPPAPDQPGHIEQQWGRVAQDRPRQGTRLLADATGSKDEATMFTKRCRPTSPESETYTTSPSRTRNRCAAK